MEKLNKKQIDELKEIEKNAEESIIQDLLIIYEQQLKEFLVKGQEYLTDKDLASFASFAHKLKSSAGNLGLIEPFDICLKLETDSKSGQTSELQQYFILLQAESEKAVKELKTYVAA